MKEQHRGAKRPARPVGFWSRHESTPGVVSIRDSSSRFARSLAFLRRLVRWERKDV